MVLGLCVYKYINILAGFMQITLKPLLSKLRMLFSHLWFYGSHNLVHACALVHVTCVWHHSIGQSYSIHTAAPALIPLACCSELTCSLTSREAYQYSTSTRHISCSQHWRTAPRICSLVLSLVQGSQLNSFLANSKKSLIQASLDQRVFR